MHRPHVAIVSPALAAANNGNWQTASRWRRLLQPQAQVRVTGQWPDASAARDDALIALHARRSADAIGAWHARHGSAGLAVVLTGTDLYVDLDSDPVVQRSLQQAGQLVVLQDQALADLPAQVRAKARVILQSTTPLAPLPKPARRLQVVVVGHLRAVKDPQTVFDAVRLLEAQDGITVTHVGSAEGDWLAAVQATAQVAPWYRWAGPLPHHRARALIRRADLLLHPSRAEGGAHVLMEAACSGTPVLAARVPGNVGMLGGDYAGYFPVADVPALVTLLRRCRAEQLAGIPAGGLLATLGAQCRARAPLFDPAAERAALLHLLHDLLKTP